MNKLLLISGNVFSALLSIAQPTLTAANSNLVPGEINTLIPYNWVAPGNSGANQTWNFSTITTNPAETITNYTTTTVQASLTAQYPNANIAMNYASGAHLFKTSSTASQTHGVYFPMNSSFDVIYQDPWDAVRYPFTYGNNYMDNYTCIQGVTGSQMFTRGVNAVNADSYGTLILPNGTFSNVLRIYHHVIGKDSSGISQQTNFINDEYYWYIPNTHYPVVSNTTINYGGTMYYFMSVLQLISTGISETTSVIKSFNFYPNPNNGKILNLDLNLTENAKYEIGIVDNLGREVLRTGSDNLFEGYNLKTIDLSGLESGIYNLGVILEDGKTLNRKITIQK